MWQITEMPFKNRSNGDWICWFRTTDGVSIRVEFAGQVQQTRAYIIAQQIAGIINHNMEP